MTETKWTLKIATLAATVLVASCAGGKISKLEKMPRDQQEFNNALANEYEALAKKESHIYNDGIDARHFAVKGLQAAAGMMVMPEDPKDWGVNKEEAAELMSARDRLMFALDRGGRWIEPELGAKTQVAYDCLVEELEEGARIHKHQKQEISVCRKLLDQRLMDLETAVFKNGPVRRVHFDYNSANIEHDGMMTVADVAARINQFQDRKIMIVGHADPVGKRSRNLTLSQNRANNVKKALIAHGIDAGMITTTVGRGELKTSNREFEPNNRVADIYFY